MPIQTSEAFPSSPVRPIEQDERTAMLDILRGWALIGVVLVNYFLFFYMEPNARIPGNDIASRVVKTLISIFFTNKSRIMLNVLFGYGFSILISNLRSRGINPIPFFARRMFWLFVLGLINTCLYYGDFLKDYALIGLVMLLFFRASARASLLFVVLFLIVYPGAPYLLHSAGTGPPSAELGLYESHSILNVFRYDLLEGTKDYLAPWKLLGADLFALACFLWGQFLQRRDFFNHLQENKKYIKRAFWGGLAAAIGLAALRELDGHFDVGLLRHYDIQFWIEFAQMNALMAALTWLYLAGRFKMMFRSLQYVGRMTLTNYMMQNMIGLFLFSGVGFAFLRRFPFYGYPFLAVLVYGSQIYFSAYWLARFKYGPVEWVWRSATYQTVLPIRKTKQS